jgi:hypothetical protein
MNDVYILRYFSQAEEGKTDSKICYDMLVEMLTSFNARLFQANGRWTIVRITEWAEAGSRSAGASPRTQGPTSMTMRRPTIRVATAAAAQPARLAARTALIAADSP